MCEARKRLRTWVEGVACAPAVTGRVLLNATTHLTWGVASELDDVKGVEDAGGVLKLIVDGVLSVPGRDPAPRSGYRSETVRRARPASSHARCQTCLGPGPLKRAVLQPPLESSGSHPTNTHANGHNTTNNNQQPSKHPVHKTRPGQETDPAKLPHQVQQLT